MIHNETRALSYNPEIMKVFYHKKHLLSSVFIKMSYQLQNIIYQQYGVRGSGNNNLSPITHTADVNTVSQLFNLVNTCFTISSKLIFQ